MWNVNEKISYCQKVLNKFSELLSLALFLCVTISLLFLYWTIKVYNENLQNENKQILYLDEIILNVGTIYSLFGIIYLVAL